MLSNKEKAALRRYWAQGGGYAAIRISAKGEVLAKKGPGGAWGILETTTQAKRSAEYLIKKHNDWKHPHRGFHPDKTRKVRKK